jgi:hypothetical protein
MVINGQPIQGISTGPIENYMNLASISASSRGDTFADGVLPDSNKAFQYEIESGTDYWSLFIRDRDGYLAECGQQYDFATGDVAYWENVVAGHAGAKYFTGTCSGILAP